MSSVWLDWKTRLETRRVPSVPSLKAESLWAWTTSLKNIYKYKKTHMESHLKSTRSIKGFLLIGKQFIIIVDPKWPVLFQPSFQKQFPATYEEKKKSLKKLFVVVIIEFVLTTPTVFNNANSYINSRNTPPFLKPARLAPRQTVMSRFPLDSTAQQKRVQTQLEKRRKLWQNCLLACRDSEKIERSR